MYKAEMYKVATLKSGKFIACMFILLTMQSTALQAEMDAASGQMPEAVVEAGSDKQQNADQRRMAGMRGDSSRWPERRQVTRELTPPPPPGPYRSTALTEHTNKGRSFTHTSNKPVRRSTSSPMPMDMYSPDRPWPDNLRPSKRLIPQNGSHHVSPAAQNKRYQATPHNVPPHAKNAYRSGPPMSPSGNWPTMSTSGSRWMPSMGPRPDFSHSRNSYPVAPYQSRPNRYQKGGPQYNGSGYKQPVNRSPYPSQGKP